MYGPVVRRQLALADVAAAAEAARWQREQDALLERSAEKHEAAAVAAAQYRAESAGDHIDALAIARGEIPGRTMADVLGAAMAAADRPSRDRTQPYGSEGNPAVLIDGQELPEPVRRSGDWPGSEAELDRLLGRAAELHRELVAYRARYDYAAAEAEYRARAEHGRTASRSTGAGPEITRAATAAGNHAWP
jgi:hypothetical protein